MRETPGKHARRTKVGASFFTARVSTSVYSLLYTVVVSAALVERNDTHFDRISRAITTRPLLMPTSPFATGPPRKAVATGSVLYEVSPIDCRGQRDSSLTEEFEDAASSHRPPSRCTQVTERVRLSFTLNLGAWLRERILWSLRACLASRSSCELDNSATGRHRIMKAS